MTSPSSSPSLRKKNHFSRWVFAGTILLLLGLVFFLSHRSTTPEAQSGKAAKNPTPVVLTAVTTQTVPVELKTIGNVESVSSINIKSQIDGRITSIQFREGALVNKGQLLFTLDTQPIEAAIDQAEATVARDQAQVAQAQAQLMKDEAQVRQAVATLRRDQAQGDFARSQEKRYSSLLSQQFISQSEYEQTLAASQSAQQTVAADRAALQNAKAILDADRAAIQSAQANVKADQANLESSRIQLAYCYIRAPFSGRTGSLKVHVGDTLQANNTSLVALDQITPINVAFSIPEQSMRSIRTPGNARPFTVSVITRENPPTQLSGQLKFMENTVDVATGTIRLKAAFQNQGQHLWPGQFVDVSLRLAQEANALVIPSQAIQSGQKGDYVFVAKDGLAQMRPVVVDRVVKDMAVIRSGLSVGEAVVTDGQFQLIPGSPIRQTQPSKQAATGQQAAAESSKPTGSNPAGR